MTLEERIRAVAADLEGIETAITGVPGRLQDSVERSFLGVCRSRIEMQEWCGDLIAREHARSIMSRIDRESNPTLDICIYGGREMSFQSARLLSMHSYLATCWSLADRIARFVGPIYCPTNIIEDAKDRPSLVSTYIQSGKKQSSLLAHEMIRNSFGWPIGLSYAIRNHFIHDGGQRDGWTFFDGPGAVAGFKISTKGWNFVNGTAKSYGVEPSHTKAPEILSLDDLRVLLDICHRELDEALGVLLGSACGLLKTKLSILIGAG